jgi:hypothetical protein
MVKFMGLAMPLLNILGCDFTETDFILILIQFDTEIFFLIKRSGPNCLVIVKYLKKIFFLFYSSLSVFNP